MSVRNAAMADMAFIMDAYRLAFAVNEAWTRNYVRMTGIDCFRILEKDGVPAAVWAVVPCGHWFGGRAVPAANIAHIAIQPEFRGGGLAAEIMELSCDDARKGGACLASLFASTRPVYRRSGFNLAGHEMIYEAQTAEFYKIRQDIRVRRIPLAEAQAVLDPIYRRACRNEAGLLDRNDAHWNARLDETTYIPSVFVLGDDEGYVVIETPSEDVLEIRDWAALNGAAARQILKFIGTFSTVYRTVRWHGAPQDALVFAMPDKGWSQVHQEEFLMRVLDPIAALNARGYACDDGNLTLTIEGDEPQVLHLALRDGKASCTPGRGEGPSLSIEAAQLPSLFSGFRSASFLHRAGHVDGDPEAVVLADRIFAGPPPWVAEHF
ncbi:GNAT family N-acetyltransferase [Shinella sp. CPCC 100929]|uniref:GNAT family N-acetyltransferase n=1 Tax=Shinella lacus TaxID=2654216 RepID=A0ABT1RD03_9HYPH|nr:GNAT family N-acetyltransferase [Shinella lacus]MCQ4633027.1 GNAT family N-acetyltransferase [Shinella lacus]